ncbi:MAG: hypothetical protein GF364_15220 [Candidatus Lokiarchaeota archaeon]|nr:hypothetical protein [Candidatus Lokiarchaeota archaeon]
MVKIKDYNKVEPVKISGYIQYYLDVLKELNVTEDKSKNQSAIKLMRLAKTDISENLKGFKNKISEENYLNLKDVDENEIVGRVLDDFKPVLQDLLLLNYYLFLVEIESGLLICPECRRWFPIIKTIPRLFPKTMDRQEIDMEFQKKWVDLFPNNVV